ncbi:MAG: alpha/beta hydrolase, partial [Bacteroidota bacterium]
MYLKYYKNLTYWKKYLPFLPQKYQAQFETPNEAYWNWKTAKIHLDYKIKKTSKITVILIHGAGGNGRILSMFTSFLIANDINYYAPDNLGYGLTQLSNKRFVYDDWVDMLSDFTEYVIQKEDTPVVLIGMSVGGMLAYQVASRVKAVRGVIVT